MSLVALRKAFPYLALAVLAAAVLYATSFGTLPRADLTFNNATEIKTLDPAQATGEPEGRVIEGLFEGLLRRLPAAEYAGNRENTTISPQFATADRMDVSEEGRTYTFHIREAAKWSDGSALTSHDFAWSWMRTLHPETIADYKYQLHYIVGAKQFSSGNVEVGQAVEVELDDRPNPNQTFPRGTLLSGTLRDVIYPPIEIDKSTEESEGKTTKARRDATLFVVEIDGKRRLFAVKPSAVEKPGNESQPIEAALWVLPDFAGSVGIRAPDDRTLVVTLENPTHYFPDLLAFYPLYPVNRACVERHGWPDFTKAGNLVSNGPFKIHFRRIRDRLRMVKNPHYWNADQVQLESIDAMAVSSDIAALNMYLTGQLDWITNVPPTIIPEIRGRADFHSAPIASTYYYRLNNTRPPLDNPLVRKALSLAIDRQQICEKILRAGEVPTTSFVPPGMNDYQPQGTGGFDPAEALQLLDKAGYPRGRGFRKIEILYNTHETHQAIAEVVQNDWKKYLGIDVELRGMEWGTYLNAQQTMEYDVSRAGWNADYLDPITFLDMFVKNGANNQTGWSNKRYDELLHQSGSEVDPARRLQLLQQAEQILLDEQAILPICHYTSKDFVQPYVAGFYCNQLKSHPLHLLKVDRGQGSSVEGSSVEGSAIGRPAR